MSTDQRPSTSSMSPHQVNMFSTFSGIGGLDLGLERAGMATVAQVEIDPYCRQVLARHWPEVPRHDDVRTAITWWQSQQRPRVHVVAGGFPCQPVSDSGRKMAQQDPRWLWPPLLDIIAALRPMWFIGENVPGLRRRGLALVLRDLANIGYNARAGYASACSMGAPHPRDRMFILAHAKGEGRCPWRPLRSSPDRAHEELQDVRRPGRRSWWTTEPRVGRVAYGVPGGVDRRTALGNSVVPAVAEHIGRLITGHAATTTEDWSR